MASKRQVFKRGQKVFICTSKEGKYNLPIWVPAVVTNPEPKMCTNTASWHNCYSSCRQVPDSRFVDVVKLDLKGKRITDMWAKKTVRNARNIIMDEEAAKPLLEELVRRKAHRDQAFVVRTARNDVQRRIEKAVVPMAKALKKIQVGFRDGTMPLGKIRQVTDDVLELLKAPKKTED